MSPPPGTGDLNRPDHAAIPTARRPGGAHRPTNAFSSVRTQLNPYPIPHLDQHSIRRYLLLP
jgi:hypothetical protein